VTGQLEADARAAITTAGLVAGTSTQEYSATVASGHVIRTSPVAATQVAPGSTVNFVVSSGQPPLVGSLTVDIEPEYARTADAKWRVDGGDWHVSGETANTLAVGDHVVAFSDIPAQDTGGCAGSKVTYTTPAEQHVTITANQTTTITATYEKASKDLAAAVPFKGQQGDLLLFGAAAATLAGLTSTLKKTRKHLTLP
jgi:hypothetical protein